MNDDEMLKIAWEMIHPGQNYSTVNSDINIVWFNNKILPLCRRMYDEGAAAGGESMQFHYEG